VLFSSDCSRDLHSFPTRRSSDLARAKETGAHRIELYTEPYARAFAAGDYAAELDRFAAAAEAAAAQGLGVNAGHDLNLANLPTRSEEHTSELQSREKLVCRPLLE